MAGRKKGNSFFRFIRRKNALYDSALMYIMQVGLDFPVPEGRVRIAQRFIAGYER